MSEPYEEEMLNRARWLCDNRGEREIRLDKAHDVPFKAFRSDRLSLAIEVASDQVQVAMTFEWISVAWLIYYVEPWAPDESIFRTKHYQECVELMRGLMLLDDLADV